MINLIMLMSIMLWGGGGTGARLYNRASSGFQETASWPFGPSFALAEDSSRNILFLSSGGGVLILQESNGNYSEISEIRSHGGVVYRLLYDHQTATLYVGSFDGLLEAWSISDPYNPALASAFRDTFGVYYRYGALEYSPGYSFVRDIILNGDYLYASFVKYTGYPVLTEVYIFNKSDISNPIASIVDSNDHGHIGISNNHLFVNNRVYDVTNPASPSFIDTIPYAIDANAFYVDEHYAYINVPIDYMGIDDSLYILNIDDVQNPTLVCALDLYYAWSTGYALIRKFGNSLYFLTGKHGFLYQIDVSNPTSPYVVTTGWIPGFVFDVSGLSGSVKLASGEDGLTHFVIDTLGYGHLIKKYEARAAQALDLLSDGNGHFYYITRSHRSSYITVSVLNGDLEQVGRIRLPNRRQFQPQTPAAVNGGFLYLLDDTVAQDGGGWYTVNNYLDIIDVRDPQNPQLASSFIIMSSGDIRSIKIVGDYAYVLTLDSVIVYNISDPISPVFVSSFTASDSLGYSTAYFDIEGNIAVVLHTSGLAIFDVSQLSLPVLTSVFHFPSGWSQQFSGNDLVIDGDTVYVSGNEQGRVLYSIDISNPSQPESLSIAPFDSIQIDSVRYYQIWDFYRLHKTGNYIVGAMSGTSWEDGELICALDVSHPNNPAWAGYYFTIPIEEAIEIPSLINEEPRAIVYTDGDYVYYATDYQGVHKLAFNPTGIGENNGTFERDLKAIIIRDKLQFSLTHASSINLRVFDVSGRLVMAKSGRFSRGTHSISVKGLSDGIYFYRMDDGTVKKKGKFILVK